MQWNISLSIAGSLTTSSRKLSKQKVMGKMTRGEMVRYVFWNSHSIILLWTFSNQTFGANPVKLKPQILAIVEAKNGLRAEQCLACMENITWKWTLLWV